MTDSTHSDTKVTKSELRQIVAEKFGGLKSTYKSKTSCAQLIRIEINNLRTVRGIIRQITSSLYRATPVLYFQAYNLDDGQETPILVFGGDRSFISEITTDLHIFEIPYLLENP